MSKDTEHLHRYYAGTCTVIDPTGVNDSVWTVLWGGEGVPDTPDQPTIVLFGDDPFFAKTKACALSMVRLLNGLATGEHICLCGD